VNEPMFMKNIGSLVFQPPDSAGSLRQFDWISCHKSFRHQLFTHKKTVEYQHDNTIELLHFWQANKNS